MASAGASSCLLILLYLPTGLAGYGAFGAITQGDILTNFGVDDPLADVARGCIAVPAPLRPIGLAPSPSPSFPRPLASPPATERPTAPAPASQPPTDRPSVRLTRSPTARQVTALCAYPMQHYPARLVLHNVWIAMRARARARGAPSSPSGDASVSLCVLAPLAH